MLNLMGIALSDFISKGNVITAIVLAILGVAISLLSMRITRAIRKTNEVQNDDKILILMKSLGIIFLLIGLILIAIPA